MKITHASTALFTCLVLAYPSQAQETAPTPAPPVSAPEPQASSATPLTPSAKPTAQEQALNELKNSALLQAYSAAWEELAPILSVDNVKAKLKQLDRFEFSTETKKKLFELFGNENPLHLKSKPLKNGNAELAFVWDSIDYQDTKSGSKTHTSELSGKSVFSQRFSKEHTVAKLASISFDDGKSTQVSANGFSYVSDQNRGDVGLWFGTGVAKLDHLSFDDRAKDVHVNVDGVTVKSELKKRGKLVDMASDSVIKSINWGSDSVGPVHMAFKVSNIDAKEFAAFVEKAKALNQTQPTDAQRTAATVDMVKKLGIATLKQGGAIEIPDISVQYHGMTAGLNGRIAFNNVLESDFATPKLIAEKVVARFDLHVPMALVTYISRKFSRSSLETQSKSNGQPVTDQAVDAMAKGMVDNMMAKPLQEKWIRIENGTLLSTIEFKMGKLSVNGQAVPLPTSNATPKE
jgi:uncharacterized protein YdgA (DUF945 family)